MYVNVALVGLGENAEFFELVASTYQGFFETKRTLFLETRKGALVECCEETEEETVLDEYQ